METNLPTAYQISALNDLIRINYDRITGYKKKIETILDDDLENLFSDFIYQSHQNIEELTRYIHKLGGKLTIGSALSGKFYQAWINLTSSIYKQTRQTLLDYCEYCEDVSKSAYQKAFDDNEVHWGKKETVILKRQLNDLKNSYTQIKRLKDNALKTA
jgi:uncharacterized protein (TIGR02284 family)